MKKIQWVAVSVCFVLAVTLWFLVTLNKQTYTTAFDVPVKLVNFPDHLQLREDFPKEMRIYASGPGIKLLYQDFAPIRDTVEIDFSQYREQGYFAAEKNLKVITQALKDKVVAIGAEPDTIWLAFAVKSSKRVPVQLDVEFDVPPSYRVPPGAIDFDDSVTVVGPMDSLITVLRCKTQHVVLPFATKPQEVFVGLDSLPGMQIIPKNIVLRYTPIPYTEMDVRFPVIATGMPVGTTLHISPDSVAIKLLAPLERADAMARSGIQVEVDYASLDRRSPMVVPKIRNVPADVEVVSFSPWLLRYIMIVRE